MAVKEYSASAVKFSFWFSEFRKVISLLCSGKTMPEIKMLADDENIFSAPTEARSKQIMNTVTVRVSSLSEDFYVFFDKCDISVQKLIALVAIMNTDSLFFDFMYEVFREKLITGDSVLPDSDIRVFFNHKQRENERAAAWTDGTLDHLKKSYKTYLSEAGLIDRSVGDRKIIKPLLDSHFEQLLKDAGMEQFLNILIGAR
jgi:hypothetical protein